MNIICAIKVEQRKRNYFHLEASGCAEMGRSSRGRIRIKSVGGALGKTSDFNQTMGVGIHKAK